MITSSSGVNTSALLRIEPADYYRQLTLRLRAGEELPLEEVVCHLESIGYQRREPVEMVGEYSVRGGTAEGGAKLTYARLTRYAGQDGKCYPAVETLATEIALSARQAKALGAC